MRTKVCQLCGNPFRSEKSEAVYCSECSPKARAATVVQPRVCRQCGCSFMGGPRAWYCPDCRKKRKRESDARHYRLGSARPLGSKDFCTVCGKEYFVESARQMYCKDCAEAATKANVSASKRVYMAQNHERLDAIARERKKGIKLCKICGKPITAESPTVTCSPECAATLKAQWQRDADSKRGKRKS